MTTGDIVEHPEETYDTAISRDLVSTVTENFAKEMVEEFAQLRAFLCSDGSGFTTGETILCEGCQVESML